MKKSNCCTFLVESPSLWSNGMCGDLLKKISILMTTTITNVGPLFTLVIKDRELSKDLLQIMRSKTYWQLRCCDYGLCMSC